MAKQQYCYAKRNLCLDLDDCKSRTGEFVPTPDRSVLLCNAPSNVHVVAERVFGLGLELGLPP